MVDKPIIINGVDVSGCEHLGLYKEYKLKCGGCYPVDCSDNPNCYYKQLLRKEQECEKAKQNAQDTYDLWQALIDSFNILQGDKIKLEQECERLKKECEIWKNQVLTLDDEAITVQITQQQFEEYNKLKIILTEIKKLAEKHKVTAHCDYLIDMDNILQKISKVEND